MQRTRLLLAGAVVSAACAATVASAQAGPPAAHASRVAKVALRHTSVGRVLVDASGFTLFTFTKDSRNKDACVKISECPATWPALSTTGRPIAGQGVRSSLLSTIKLPNGTKQVTYAGHPLYRYREASEAGETTYVGANQFGGKWYAINAAGGSVK
jgi:predicted lipoprotein with Yx(FWY)xxD motif